MLHIAILAASLATRCSSCTSSACCPAWRATTPRRGATAAARSRCGSTRRGAARHELVQSPAARAAPRAAPRDGQRAARRRVAPALRARTSHYALALRTPHSALRTPHPNSAPALRTRTPHPHSATALLAHPTRWLRRCRVLGYRFEAVAPPADKVHSSASPEGGSDVVTFRTPPRISSKDVRQYWN